MASKMLLGYVVPCMKQGTTKVRVRRMELDTNLNMYFKKDEFYMTHDPEKLGKTGDVVLIEKLKEQFNMEITHKLNKIVYPMGDITCPLTGKKVVVGQYRDQIESKMNLFGKSKEAFNYEKAQPRGRLEGTHDFTHGETYIKYHEDGKPQPFAV